VDRGRFLVDQDDAGRPAWPCSGDNVRKQLFADRQVLPGAGVAINGLPFRIVGLMPPRTRAAVTNAWTATRSTFLTPTMMRDLPPADPNFQPGILTDLIYVPGLADGWKDARTQVTPLLARNHHFDPEDTGALYFWDTVENAHWWTACSPPLTASWHQSPW